MQTKERINESLLSQEEPHQPDKSILEKYRELAAKAKIGGSSIFQVIMFTWVQPLLSYGNKKTIDVQLMPALPQSYSTSSEFNRFQNIWSKMERHQKEGRTLITALLKLHSRQWIFMFINIFVVVILFMASPVLTALNIDYLTNHRDNLNHGIFLFILTIIVTLSHRILFSQYLYRFMNLGIRLSNIVTMIVYNKSLKYSPLADKEFSEAQIINYSQVDAQRLVQVGDQIAAFFYGPLQIVFGLFMMYYILGFTFITTISIIFIILIVSYFLSKITVKLNEEVLKAKDERMKVTEEMIDIIRYIKISAIEKFFYKKINEKREKEVSVILKQGINFICIACLYWLTCPILIASAYLTYILLGNQITPQVAFTTMTIVNLFEYPMYSLPNAVSESIQIFTSLKRIEKYLFAKEISGQHIHYSPSSSSAIEIQKGNFYWKKQQKKEEKKDEKKEGEKEVKKDQKNQSETEEVQEQSSHSEEQELKKFKEKDEKGKPIYIHALKDINMSIKKGSFTMILGDIGSGKSSLLQAILNEILTADNSNITLSGSLAYSPQKPWIMSKTLKENVVFASQHSQSKLRKVLHYACLEEDLKMFPKGLETEIGQKGINLSGGQKARVSLARSLYSNRDILLLDDILSAVDVHVGEFIVKETVRDFLNGKTVVMPTHAIKFAPDADDIILMKKGRIIGKGPYKQICDTPEFKEIAQKQQSKDEEEATHKQELEEEKAEFEMMMLKNVMKRKTTSEENPTEALQSTQIVEELMLPQDHKEGNIDSKVLKQYVNLNGGVFRFIVALSVAMSLAMLARTAASIWIQIWCQNPSEDQYDVLLYIGLQALNIVFMLIACSIIFFSGAKQSTSVHKEVIRKLLYASLNNFYNRVPTGRIINRLTKDLSDLDEAITYSFLFFLLNIFELLGALIICIYTTTPFAVIPMVIIAYLANQLRKYYLRTQREVTRFEKSTNSPCVSGFLSTISGLSTLRAYNKEREFTDEQYAHFDLNKRVRLTKSGLGNWFANTLAYLCFFVNIPCIGYCMFSDETDPAVMGLLMTYALFLIFNVSEVILCSANFETKLVSVERLYKFMHIQSEEGYIDYCQNWLPDEEEEKQQVFTSGKIEFKDLRVRYRKDLPDVIKGINCLIQPGQKIGIVGRTGAGKTTIINTLLGITEISKGNIFIDNKPISEITLKALRQSVTMIDQQPTLIKSTFRENLDLTHRYSDQELNSILSECNLLEVITQKGGLDATVSNTSLSAGQKQLLCICRAFLKHSKIVLVDEATANIDVKNDAIIQKVIAEKFKTSTVLTIAHRLSTLQNSDKIMVMEKGQLVEFGSPKELERKVGGVFSEMMKKHQKEMLK